MTNDKLFSPITYHLSLVPLPYALVWLRDFLLVLFWGAGLLITFRRYHFTPDSAGVAAFALLALLVAGTILLLDFLGEGRWKTLFALGPGILVTFFLVLPSCHFVGISAYLLVFLPTVAFLWYKNHRVPQPSMIVAEIVAEDTPIVESEDDLEALEAAATTEWDESVQMRLLRRKEPNETELLEAWVRADFQQGERVVHVHVPFCPPFREQPKWEACQFEGDEVEIQLSQMNSLGMRIDLKRPSPRKNQESVGIYLSFLLS